MADCSRFLTLPFLVGLSLLWFDGVAGQGPLPQGVPGEKLQVAVPAVSFIVESLVNFNISITDLTLEEDSSWVIPRTKVEVSLAGVTVNGRELPFESPYVGLGSLCVNFSAFGNVSLKPTLVIPIPNPFPSGMLTATLMVGLESQYVKYVLRGPGDIYLRDQKGRLVAHNWTGIDGALYEDSDETQIVTLPAPQSGVFDIKVVGRDEGQLAIRGMIVHQENERLSTIASSSFNGTMHPGYLYAMSSSVITYDRTLSFGPPSIVPRPGANYAPTVNVTDQARYLGLWVYTHHVKLEDIDAYWSWARATMKPSILCVMDDGAFFNEGNPDDYYARYILPKLLKWESLAERDGVFFYVGLENGRKESVGLGPIYQKYMRDLLVKMDWVSGWVVGTEWTAEARDRCPADWAELESICASENTILVFKTVVWVSNSWMDNHPTASGYSWKHANYPRGPLSEIWVGPPEWKNWAITVGIWQEGVPEEWTVEGVVQVFERMDGGDNLERCKALVFCGNIIGTRPDICEAIYAEAVSRGFRTL